MKQIILKARRDASLRRFHPWVFSGAVAKRSDELADGDIVEVRSQQGDLLGIGHFQEGSILVRLFAFGPAEIDQAFWTEKIRKAWQYRQQLGLPAPQQTNCYRLIHAEGDGLPGLVIDIYDQVAVVQCHSIGMHRQLTELVTALRTVFGESLQAVYDKSARSLPARYSTEVADGYVWGHSTSSIALENGITFNIDWEQGQKTGFFLDQRTNRALLGQYAGGKKVLNTFCYTGGFSLYALMAGSRQVDSVDVSERAIQLTDENVARNFPDGIHQSYTEDVLTFLKQADTDYDIIVVDPPAFAKSIKKRHQAVQGYKRLNALALRKLKPGGMLFTFSCSQVVDKTLFDNTIVAAAVEARRKVRIMHHLNQPPDHPVSLFHPEGSYLKGLVLYVE